MFDFSQRCCRRFKSSERWRRRFGAWNCLRHGHLSCAPTAVSQHRCHFVSQLSLLTSLRYLSSQVEEVVCAMSIRQRNRQEVTAGNDQVQKWTFVKMHFNRQAFKARLHGSPRLINAVESTKVNRVNSSFQRKWSTGLMGEQVGDGQLSFVVDSLWVTHHRLPV
jgi:hypothetical protein